MPNYNYKVKLHSIRAFAFDVDGVLTDGSILSTPDGDLLRTFDSKDGFALRMCSMKGYPVAIITGGVSQSIVHRFKGLGVKEEDIYQKSRDKVPDFLDFCSRHGLKPEEVAFAGDDMPDIPVLRMAGLAVAPADAVPEVKDVCDYVSLPPHSARLGLSPQKGTPRRSRPGIYRRGHPRCSGNLFPHPHAG